MSTPLPPVWADSIATFALHLRAAGRAESTIGTRTEHVRWLATAHADRSPWALTLEDLTGWMGSRSWARETRRSVRASLRAFYAWGQLSGRCASSPAASLPTVSPTPPRPRPTPDDVLRIALTGASTREQLMVRLAAECGLRRAEVAVIHSRDLSQDLLGWSLEVHGKGSKDRTVPLPPIIAVMLRSLPEGYAFPGRMDGHLSPRYVGKLVAQLLPGAWTMHSLRHRAATRWYAVDHDLLLVGELLGHASINTTRTYVKLPDDAARRTVMAAAA